MVSAQGLSKYFKSGSTVVKAVDDVTFDLPRGKMIAIKGASGSGKSTLLNLLGALDKPSSGKIRVDDVDVSELHGTEEVDYRLKKVGFVFQAYYLLPDMTALENVMLPMEMITGKEDRTTKAKQLLEKVGIAPSMFGRHPAKLSGGEQQRVAIARALSNSPVLLLADEPTGNLDSQTGQRIVDLLHRLSQDGRTVVLATHDLTLAKRADLVMTMQDGKIVDKFVPEETKESAIDQTGETLNKEDFKAFQEWKAHAAEFKEWKDKQIKNT